MSAVQRVARWKVAELADVRSGSDHNLSFSFKLDLSQLPRPFQIGVAGQRDWSIAIESAQPLLLQTARPVEPAKESPVEVPK
jgi:sulfite reductase beta subunit-like hemoprotein